MKRRLIAFYFGPLLIWMAFIFVMSTGAGSTTHSTGLLRWGLGHIAPSFLDSLSAYQLDRLDYGIRKFGHVSEYMVLALLAVRAFQFGFPCLRRRSFYGALGLSVFYALTDEFHQWFVPGRTPALFDVLIDTSGSFLCMAGILLWFGLKRVERSLWGRSRFMERNEAGVENSQRGYNGDVRPYPGPRV